MSDRTKLLKKAVLTGVGASSNIDRVKKALEEALEDLVKVGQDLIDDLEEKGKEKSESTQSFLKGFQDEAAKRTGDIEKKVSAKVSKNFKKVAREVGIVTFEQYDELLKRICHLENHAGSKWEPPIDAAVDVESAEEVVCEEDNSGKKNKKAKKQEHAE
jgi:polyhydroxyalkanoate synthesis regulator phasin